MWSWKLANLWLPFFKTWKTNLGFSMVAVDIYKVPGKPRSISTLEVCEYKVRAACLYKWGILAGPIILLKWISKGSLWHFLFCMFFQQDIVLSVYVSMGSCPKLGLLSTPGLFRGVTLCYCHILISGTGLSQWQTGLLSPPSASTWASPHLLALYIELSFNSQWKKESFNLQAFMEGNLKVSLPNNFILVMRK